MGAIDRHKFQEGRDEERGGKGKERKKKEVRGERGERVGARRGHT